MARPGRQPRVRTRGLDRPGSSAPSTWPRHPRSAAIGRRTSSWPFRLKRHCADDEAGCDSRLLGGGVDCRRRRQEAWPRRARRSTGSVGAARAAELVAQYQPANFDAPLAPGFDKRRGQVPAARSSSSRRSRPSRTPGRTAPKMTVLPDRFVFIGYTGDDPSRSSCSAIRCRRLCRRPGSLGVRKTTSSSTTTRRHSVVPDELQWLSDFDRAVRVGMGFRIDLTRDQAARGFDRVLVVGLRLNADARAGAARARNAASASRLSRTGLAVVPQGTPTNNTEAVGSGHSRVDDPDQSFDDLKAPLFTSSTGLARQEGRAMARRIPGR